MILPNDFIKTFNIMISLPAMSCEIYLHGEKSTTVSGLSNREVLVSTQRIISVLFGIGRLRRPSDLVEPPFQAFKGHYPLHQVGIS